MHFSMNKFGLMNALMNSNLYTTEDMLMTYLFCFDHLIIFRNSKIISILNIETLDSSARKDNNSLPFLDVLIIRTSNGFKTSIIKPHLVKYIQILTVSFPKNIKLVWFSLYYFENFQLFRIFQDFIQKCVI